MTRQPNHAAMIFFLEMSVPLWSCRYDRAAMIFFPENERAAMIFFPGNERAAMIFFPGNERAAMIFFLPEMSVPLRSSGVGVATSDSPLSTLVSPFCVRLLGPTASSPRKAVF